MEREDKPDRNSLVPAGEGPENEPSDVARVLAGNRRTRFGRFVVAALGSIPWVGGVVSASAALHAELEQGRTNEMLRQWLAEHEQKVAMLGEILEQIADRLDEISASEEGPVTERLQDERYLSLVRQGFRTWDKGDTQEKRDHIRRCLTNAAATKLCSDDVVRLFISWIEKYDEAHLAVIRALYYNRGATRAYIWDQVHGEEVREDSAEADLYKLLIFDLNTGRVLRQIRDKNEYGQFLAKRRRTKYRNSTTSEVLESAFENTKPYELTELGKQFVHYVMDEAVPRLGSGV